MEKTTIAVIGYGALTLSVAAQFSARGAAVTYVDTNKNPNLREALSRQPVIHVTGAAVYDAPLAQVTGDPSVIRDADIVAVSIPPSQRAELFPLLADLVRPGQHLIFFPASFGVLEFSALLNRHSVPGVTLAEAVSYPYVCELRGNDTLYVQSIKQTLGLSVQPAARGEELLGMYNRFFDIFTLRKNCLETSLDNMNLTLHPLPVLLNLGAMDGDVSTFRHYMDGVTPHVANIMEQLDRERMALGDTLGVSLTSTLDQLKQFYGDSDASGIGEYVSSPEGPYTEVRGFGLNSRYITEDVPFLLVAMETLGTLVGSKLPVTSMTIDLACSAVGVDYRKCGYSPEKLGLSGKTAAEMMKEKEKQLCM